MIGALPFPFGLPRLRLSTLGLAGIAGPVLLSPDAAAANPALTGAVILTALLMFGSFVLARWRILLLTAPIWIVLLGQSDQPAVPKPDDTAIEIAAPAPAPIRPLARPWG